MPCDVASDCPTDGKINLLIAPERNANEVNWHQALHNRNYKGHIVAIIRNNDTKTFAPLSLAPGEVAYLYVGPTDKNQSNVRNVAYYKINRETGAVLYKLIVTNHICPKAKHANVAVHLSTMNECAVASDSGSTAQGLVPQGGLWVSCDNGCCQVGASKKWYTSATATPSAPK